MIMEDYKKEFIEHLATSGALRFGEFTLKSGRPSKYFINMGIAVNTGAKASATAAAYANKIASITTNFTYIHGPAYSAIALSALVAAKLSELKGIDKRWGFDRKEPKPHGDPLQRHIMGDLREGDRILILDDVVTTGSTKKEAMDKLTSVQKGLTFEGIVIAVDRQEVGSSGKSAKEELEEIGLPLHSIVTAPEIFEYLRGRKISGKVYVTEELYQGFKEDFEKFGAK